MKIIQDYSNPTMSPNSKIHLLGAMLNINQLGFVNLTYKWNHMSNVWIPDFYLSFFCFFSKILSLQNLTIFETYDIPLRMGL